MTNSKLLSQFLPALPALKAVRAERARRSFHEFVRQAWSIVEPAVPFIDAFHIGAICEHLQAVSRGEIQNLLINVPPGHGKSLIVSVCWPAWMWIERASWRGLFGSYASDLSLRDSVRCRSLIESPWYQQRFAHDVGGGITMVGTPSWRISSDQNVKSYFTNTRTGARLALSVGGKATGFRGNLVCVDDPLNATDAMSKIARDDAISWWDITMSSRLNDMGADAKVIIMQRLHDDDLSGHVVRQGGYEHLCLPTEFDAQRRSATHVRKPEHTAWCDGYGSAHLYESVNPVNGEVEMLTAVKACPCPRVAVPFWCDPRAEDGDLLFPDLFPESVLKTIRKVLGSTGYAGQHQQRPTPEDGERFKRAWWRFWKPDGTDSDESCPRPKGCYQGPARALPGQLRMTISLDATFKGETTSDYVVFTVWATYGADRYLLDRVRGKFTFTETIEHFKALTRKYPRASRKLVEDKANGSAIIDTLTRTVPGIIAVNPEGGKEARASAVQPQIESGNVFLPDGAPWLDEFVDEFAFFPLGKHDDQVDSTTQALHYLGGSTAVARAGAMGSL